LDDSDRDPDSRQEALASQDVVQWLGGEREEYNSIMEHDVYDLVEREPGMKVYKTRPVYKKKRNEMGIVVRWKVRFNVAAYKNTMHQGIDFAEKYAGTARWQTVVL
jgi:hypothetical protein